MTTISVVIPAYNAADSIERALNSIRGQTRAPLETLVVDDGSTDGTAALAAAYLTRHGMAGRVVHQENRGVAAARNTGMRAARGTFVALLDSDDLWYPDKLASVIAELERGPEADLICHDENLTRDGRVIRVSRRRLPRGNVYESLLLSGNLLSPSAVVVRREAALELGGFDERPEYHTVEDYDFWIRFSRVRRIQFLHRVLGEYVMHERSASRRIVRHHVAQELMLRTHLEEYLRSHPGVGPSLRARRRLARVYRSAARQLIQHREAAEDQRAFVSRMLKTYPLELRNVAVAFLWIAGMLRR